MTSSRPPRASKGLLELGLETRRAKRACRLLADEGEMLIRAMKRALPFLVRQRASIVCEEPACVLSNEMLAKVGAPYFALPVRLVRGGEGALFLDAAMISRSVDGILGGGSGSRAPRATRGTLTTSERALAGRAADAIVRAFHEVLGSRGLGIVSEPAGEVGAIVGSEDGAAGGPLIAASFRVGEGETAGTVTLVLPALALGELGALGAGGGERDAGSGDPEVGEALGEVEVCVVVELGRASLPLEGLVSLAVGDTLALRVPRDGAAEVRVGDKVLFRGRPTTSGAQIAIAIDRHAA